MILRLLLFGVLNPPPVLQMWFVWAFQRWKASAVGRLRMKCMLGAHLERRGRLPYELAFKAWRKVAMLRVRTVGWEECRA